MIGVGVVLGADVSIGPFAIVEDGVEIGAGCVLAAHAVVRSGTVLGAGTSVDSFAVVGGNPQDLSFDPKIESGVLVGSRVTIREGVTINRATKPRSVTRIGDGVCLMANSHVAHDCVVEAEATIANNVMLAGHVLIGANVFIGGGAGIHQFVRIGEGAMIGGNASVSHDVPPFTTVVERNRLTGLNKVGLRRRGFAEDETDRLKRCFRSVYFGGGDPQAKAAALVAGGEWDGSGLGQSFLAFFAAGRRGFVRMSPGNRPAGTQD